MCLQRQLYFKWKKSTYLLISTYTSTRNAGISIQVFNTVLYL